MSNRTVRAAVVALLAVIPAASSFGAVSLNFSDLDATPTVGGVAPGGTLPIHVILGESATTDRVSGIDYRLSISTAGSGFFRIVSRTASTSIFTPANADSSAVVAPVTLSPTSGSASLGGDRNGGTDLAGVDTFDTATYSIQALANTPVGTYTLSFVNTSYSGAGPSFPTLAFASLGTYTIVVPEPAAGLAAATLFGVGLRRRRSAK